MLTLGGTVLAGDPTGAETLRANPESPIDYIWVLVAAFLVFLMQGGFAMLEAGLCRAKNAVNLMMKNLMDFSVGSIAFFAVGFALMFGGSTGGILGTTGWFLAGDTYDIGQYLLFMFEVVFAATAATIVSGAVAERLRIKAYFTYSFIVGALIYPIYEYWVWGSGWLSILPLGMGHLDFAGSGVVHVVGGFVGLAGAMAPGPRIGRYARDGSPRAIPGHSITLAALGAFILWFGWFGSNAGSTLSGHELRIAVIAVNTTLAASAGAIMALFVTWLRTRKLDVGMSINGAIGGLVAITASCAWVEAWTRALLKTRAGGTRIVDTLLGEMLPRIC